MNNYDIQRLACYQIDYMIKRDREVEQMKVEWFRRWQVEYPKYKNISGITEGG